MYMVEKELRNQFDAIQKTIKYMGRREEEIRDFFRGMTSVCVCGCGSSYYVAKSTALQLSQKTGLSSYAVAAGDLLVNFESYEKILEHAALILLSRSGSTTELHEMAKRCKEAFPGIKILSICGVENSAVSHLADVSLEIPWAFDRAVCQTRTVSNLYAAGLMLCALNGKNPRLVKDMLKIGQEAEDFARKAEEVLETVGEQPFENAVVLADSGMAGLAEEGALAFKEICRCPSNFFHVLDVRHGPTVTIDEDTLVILLHSRGDNKLQAELVFDMKKRTDMVLVLDCAGKGTGREEMENVLRIVLPETSCDDVSAVFMIYCIQLICLKHALYKGVNPDAPEGLDAWIKLNV